MRSIAFALVLVACGGTETPAPTPATFARVKAEVFTPSCGISTACHKGASSQEGLDLDGDAYAQLVGVMAKQKPGTLRVKASAPDESYLLDKILGRNLPTPPSAAVRIEAMPPPSGGLTEAQIAVVRDWITAGAKND